MNFYNLRNMTEISRFYCSNSGFMVLQICLHGGATEDTKMSATIYGQIFFSNDRRLWVGKLHLQRLCGNSEDFKLLSKKFHQRIPFKSD